MAPVAVMSPFDIVKSASSWSYPFPPLPAYLSITIAKKPSATSNSDHPATFGPAMMLSLVLRDDQQEYPDARTRVCDARHVCSTWRGRASRPQIIAIDPPSAITLPP